MIYVHVPFCRSFCTYCGFYSEICSRSESQQVQNRIFGAYTDAIIAEIRSRLAVTDTVPRTRAIGVIKEDSLSVIGEASRSSGGGDRATLGNVRVGTLQGGVGEADVFRPHCYREAKDTQPPETLYFGGGTPSVLPLEKMKRIVDALGPAEYEEFTVEVNPDDIVRKGLEYVRGLTELGVNRVSMGVQSFDDGILRWMNRRHDTAEALEAFRLLREGGIRNISIDLIFGLSQLSDSQWRDTFARAVALGPEHISAYQLSIEEGSALDKLVRNGQYKEADEEKCRSQYDILCQTLADAGYRHYEVSNWALPGREAVHNSAYWRRVSYIGLGPGAHSFDAESGIRSWNTEELASRDSDGHLKRWSSGQETLTETEAAEETIMLALRTADGLQLEELETLSSVLGHDSALIDSLLADGLLKREGDNVRIPENRFFVSDDIISRLI